jgi:DNA mismatch repair ATPase MutS
VDKWFKGLGVFETISSFAGIHFNFPTWSLPQIRESGLIISAKSLGHPLIPEQERICNDLVIDRKGKILIVTGPNMAGKSTFLKTAGVNLVLALAGAPVCAVDCSVSPVNLYTSMKVSDSLDKNLSLFYAELQRLKLLLEGIEKGQEVFFLMDEMLKGTNALDRQAGAMALLKQLVSNNATGIVATHDLGITKLESDYPFKVINFHFDGYVQDDKLMFDYKIKRGKCESFNALVLMRKIGIKI